MSSRIRLFLAIILLTGGVFAQPVVAAPTVNKFGNSTNNNNIPNTKLTLTKAPVLGNTTNSLPTLNSSAKSNNGINVISPVSNTENSVESARLAGLHSNFMKGITSKISANYNNTPPINNTNTSTPELTQRVVNLEEDMLTKQEILEPGDGIEINGQTISLSQEIAELPEKFNDLSQEIENLSENIGSPGSSENYYTVAQTQEYVQQAVNEATKNDTVYDSVTQEYKHVTIVDNFDEEDFMDKQKESK